MIRHNLEKRVEALEAQVAELRTARGDQAKDWQSAVAKYAGDADLASLFADAMKLREADRKRAKKRPSVGRSR